MQHRSRILVVHDDLGTREALSLLLKYYGYQVFVAHDGRQALALASDMPPDLVVMDWRFRGSSGLRLCKALRRLWPMMPIVVVSSADEVFDGDQPVNAWLRKPIDPPRLHQVIRDELAGARPVVPMGHVHRPAV